MSSFYEFASNNPILTTILGYLLIIIIGIIFTTICTIFETIFNKQKELDLPICFGSQPGPQDQAENDCFTCRFNYICFNLKRINND